MSEEYFKEKEFAEIKEVKGLARQNINGLRVYCVNIPNYFNFQIRTHGPITCNGVARNMIATVSVSIEELEEILTYMKCYALRKCAEVKSDE